MDRVGKEAPAAIQWLKDVDAAFAEARSSGKAVLIDFNAAPM